MVVDEFAKRLHCRLMVEFNDTAHRQSERNVSERLLVFLSGTKLMNHDVFKVREVLAGKWLVVVEFTDDLIVAVLVDVSVELLLVVFVMLGCVEFPSFRSVDDRVLQVRDDHFPGSGVRNEANQIAQCHTNPLQFLKGGPIEVIRIVGDQFDFRFPLFDLRNGHAFLEPRGNGTNFRLMSRGGPSSDGSHHKAVHQRVET